VVKAVEAKRGWRTLLMEDNIREKIRRTIFIRQVWVKSQSGGGGEKKRERSEEGLSKSTVFSCGQRPDMRVYTGSLSKNLAIGGKR